ncbi:hypothetical protein DFH28DRAFT_1086994 [Melampsora americana]|nr:hypothetical protein DFH28DRAFT_1086994 [Melampsora americana]
MPNQPPLLRYLIDIESFIEKMSFRTCQTQLLLNSNRTTKKKTSKSTRTDQDPLDSEVLDPPATQLEHADDQEENDDRDDSAQPGPTQEKAKKSTIFQSRFPGLELDTFEQQLDSWTVIKLQESIAQQNSRRSKAPKEIKDLIKIVRMEFEKRILSIALMAGVPEVVIWNLVGMGSKTVKANPWIRFLTFCVKCLGDKLPERDDKDAWVTRNQQMAEHWHALTPDQQDVFKDPYFFALANLPDYSNVLLGNDEDQDSDENNNGVNVTQFDSAVPTPKVHQLSEEDRSKYQPLFDELVNVEKLHLCHGKPERSSSVATLQKRSMLAVRKAHHNFSVVCQQHQISYYLTAASCGGVDGWSQTFSNSPKFADWAQKTPKIPSKFSTYVHGLEVAQEIEKKEPQPSDKQKSQLCHLLNEMMVPVKYSSTVFTLSCEGPIIPEGCRSCQIHRKERVANQNRSKGWKSTST